MKVIATLCILILASCTAKKSSTSEEDNTASPTNPDTSQNSLSLGINVTGTLNTSVTFSDENAGQVTVEQDGTFYFPNQLNEGTAYQISVIEPPSNIYCDTSEASGQFSRDLVIEIDCIAISYPTVFSYNLSNYSFLNGSSQMTIELPSSFHSTLATYSVSPSLPDGLSLNTSTGEITGTPSSTSASTTYTVTQSRYDGSTKTTDLDIEVLDGFRVNSTEDVGEDLADEGNGVCFAATAVGTNKCTLRGAIEEANALAGTQIIYFSGLITLTGSEIVISDDIVITGDDESTSILDADASDRVFTNSNSIDITLQHMTLQNANPADNDHGGGLEMLGGGNLYISNVTFKDNNCDVGEDACAIHAESLTTYEIEYSTFDNNNANWDAAIWFNNSSGSMKYVTFVNNSSLQESGAVTFTNGTHTIDYAHFENNSAVLEGGAVKVSNTAVVTIRNSSFEGNSSGVSGGAIFHEDNSNGGFVDIFSSSFVGNRATAASASGAAITIKDTGIVNVYNGAFIDNIADDNGGAIHAFNTSTISVTNSYFRENFNQQAGQTLDHCNIDPTVTASFVQNVFDTIDVDTCSLDTDTNNTTSSDFMIGTFSMLSHGWSKAYNVLSSSPLIDSGDLGNCDTIDATGIARPIDGDATAGAECDIGPIEYNP